MHQLKALLVLTHPRYYKTSQKHHYLIYLNKNSQSYLILFLMYK
ncbi:TPA: hypothetical protein RPH60_002927 [Staphylococcus aureus]|nr:hypothetical protein [Staphylococcus aureus]OHS77148.1 hypothetical protein HMPREF3284_05575 [Staphylococcus aureus]HDY5069907.1 hypothetical protein [Staphylococcus aureus]HDY5071264.1 hypothetical protein [Staphylococcus aureus]HDY5202086.1 hypothetical protein [Staphylococcus aureus]HDY5204240.1 hypothetical protein [Staphylococcus aureus]